MPVAGDVVRVNACGEYLGQDVCNVIYLVVGVWTGNVTLEDALRDYAFEWMNRTRPLQSDKFMWTNFVLDNVTNPSEGALFTPTAGNVGSKAGEGAPPFVALSFRMNRTTRITRNGYKRLAGLTESDIADGSYLLGAGDNATHVAALENFWTVPFGGADFIFDSVIMGRDATGAPDLGRINFPASVKVQIALTSQNTRKFGRGS